MRGFILLGLLIFVGLYSQSVIHTIPGPNHASGLAWDGVNLWCGVYGVNSEYIYKIDPGDGSVLDSILCPGYLNPDCYGLGFDGVNLWVLNSQYNVEMIYKITIDGTILDSFPEPFTSNQYFAGLTYDGNHVCIARYYPNDSTRVYKIDPASGDTVPPSIPTPHPQPWGLAWDGEYIWVTDDGQDTPDDGYIFKLDPTTGTVLDSFEAPGTKPRGAAWDGQYLWVTGEGPKAYLLYQIDVLGSGTPDISVSASSHDFGEVVIGSNEFWNLTIFNDGDADLIIDSITVADSQFVIPALTFPFTLVPSSDTIITITFTPAVFGEIQADLSIFSNDPDESELIVDLQGFGLYPGAVLVLSDSIHDYGEIRISGVSMWEISVVNQGASPLVMDSIDESTIFYTYDLDFPVIINSLDTLNCRIYFSPHSVISYDDTLIVYSNDPQEPHRLYLSGDGIERTYIGGQAIFSYTFVSNVVCVTAVDDVTGDGVVEIAAESYDSDSYGDPHLHLFFGNSDLRGAKIWNIGDETFTGSWGDNCLRSGGDLNADGIDDILLGTAWGDRSCYAIDAVSGDIIWCYDSHDYNGEGGWVYAMNRIPDVNGDGVDDVLAGIGGHDAGTQGPRCMYCFDGVTGDSIWFYGIQDAVGDVTYIDDVNGDGVADALCGAWGNNNVQRVYCVNGASGVMLWSYYAGADIQTIVTIPDINGDDKDDVVIGTWGGEIICLSGADGDSLWSTIVGGLVVKIARIPDAISKGVDGIVAGLITSSTLYLLSADDGGIEWTYSVGGNVWSVDAISDIDEDGAWDVLAGSQTTNSVFCISGATGSLIWQHDARRLVFSVRSVPDLNGDGYPDVIAGTQSQAGEAFLIAISSRAYVQDIEEEVVLSTLIGVYPNPFASTTNIRFDVNANIKLRVEVYNILGEKIKTIYYGNHPVGIFSSNWNGTDRTGNYLPNGIYFLSVEMGGERQNKKLVLMR